MVIPYLLNLPRRGYSFEKFSSLIYFLFTFRVVRKLMLILPDSFIGQIFVGVRKSWKKQSKESVSDKSIVNFSYNKPRNFNNNRKDDF